VGRAFDLVILHAYSRRNVGQKRGCRKGGRNCQEALPAGINNATQGQGREVQDEMLNSIRPICIQSIWPWHPQKYGAADLLGLIESKI
jgi:hypothetical protein